MNCRRLLVSWNALTQTSEKLQHKHLVLKEYMDFLTDTERNQEKINESVFTLLQVVKKEADILRRKKD